MAEPAAQPNGLSTPPIPASSADDEKPAVLIIGGLGYIGRFLALHIHKNNLASEVRLVDKVLPQLAWLAPEFAEACSQDKFMQADASREQSLSKIFTLPSGRTFTYVFNCGGETRYSQEESVYAARSLALTTTIARECARRNIPAYIEFSTGMVYKPPSSSTINQGGCTETAPTKPWLKLAKSKLQAEEALDVIRKETEAQTPGKGLRYSILRLAHVYGEYDNGFLARGLCLARVYQSKNEEMKWLYGKDLRIATVHVLDVCTAAWAAAQWTATPPPPPPAASSTSISITHNARIFNIVDRGSTSQLTLSTIIAALFAIPTGYHNALISTFARINLDSVVDDVNEDVLQPWADLLARRPGADTKRQGPISPFMERELLRDCEFCMSGKRAAEVLGWGPEAGRERLGEEMVREVVRSYERMGWWP